MMSAEWNGVYGFVKVSAPLIEDVCTNCVEIIPKLQRIETENYVELVRQSENKKRRLLNHFPWVSLPELTFAETELQIKQEIKNDRNTLQHLGGYPSIMFDQSLSVAHQLLGCVRSGIDSAYVDIAKWDRLVKISRLHTGLDDDMSEKSSK